MVSPDEKVGESKLRCTGLMIPQNARHELPVIELDGLE
jgi:hypothetical protein